MYNTTAQYKEYIKKPSRDFECRVKIGNRIFTNTEVIEIVPETVQPNDGFSIGNTVSQSIDITLKNDGGVYASAGIVDVAIGLKVGNKIEYVPIGTYNIDDVIKTDYTVKLTCYDNMIKFETGYFEKYENPTLQQVIEQLEETTGVKFEGTVPSYTVTKLSGYTCREILAYVASICGGNAFITRNGKFTIKAPTQVDYKITAANYFNTGYTKEDSTYKIGMITCQNKTNTDYTENEDYDSANDKNTISVGSLSSDTMELTFENPWVTENILNDIYSKLKDFSYLGYSMKWQGDMSLDVADIVTVVDKNNIERKALIYANKLNYTGGLTAETSAKGETKNSNSFSASGNGKSEIDRIAVKLLIAEKAIINKANIKDLQATNANISNLQATVADISTLVNGNLTSNNIHSLILTSDKVTVENGFIKNAMIESLAADKITTGTLSTNKLTIASNNGGLVLANNTIQFSDKDKNVRVQIGQDSKGDFNFIVKGTDGKTVLLDSTGLHEGAIADGLIKTDMVADAAITKNKVNYSSFIEGLNADSNLHYINASKIALDLDGQSLDIAFNKLSTSIENIEVGTKNYILASAFQEDLYLNYWELNSLNSLEEYKNEKYECNSLVCNNTINDWLESGQYINTLEKDTSYTLSFMANGEAYIYITEIAYDSSNNRNDYKVTEIEVSTDEYKKYKATFTTSSYIRYAYLTIATPRKKISKITLLQLERGIIDTNWSPAIADAEQIIADIKSVTQTNTTSINVIQGKIETLISNTTIIKDGKTTQLKDAYNSTVLDINSMKQTISEHNSTINTQSGTIESVITKTSTLENSLNGFSARVEAVETTTTDTNKTVSSINLKLDGITTSVNNKVNTSDIGTIITQNAYSVAIAIKNQTNSQAIFDSNGLTIENGKFRINRDSKVNLYIDNDGCINTQYGLRIRDSSTSGEPKTFISEFGLSMEYYDRKTDRLKETNLEPDKYGWKCDRSFTIQKSLYVDSNLSVEGDLDVEGYKNCLQKTDNYGYRRVSAYETAEYYFGDIGSGTIANSECIVYIEDIFKECVNTDITYQVFTQCYTGAIKKIDRFEDYFIVYGENGTEFGWEIKAKRKGLENVRLEERLEYNDFVDELHEVNLISDRTVSDKVEDILFDEEV